MISQKKLSDVSKKQFVVENFGRDVTQLLKGTLHVITRLPSNEHWMPIKSFFNSGLFEKGTCVFLRRKYRENHYN